MNKIRKIGFLTGIFLFIIILFFIEIDPANPQVTKMAAVAALMAAWWVTEAIPLAATSLVPLLLYPLLGLADGESIAGSYINSIIFLFLGGFLLAIAMEQSGLHKRIALKIITLFGGSPNSIIIGFMFSTAFISMWISNTATAVMMLPIGLAIIHKLEDEFGIEKTKNFSITLMLALAYACSIGGIGTLIGTPPNLAFIKIYKILFPQAPEISFGEWMLLAIPVSLAVMVVAVVLLTKIYFKLDTSLKIDRNFIRNEYLSLGRISREEKFVGAIFSSAALLWIFRVDFNLGFATIPGWQNIFSEPGNFNDGTIAIAMALLLFFIPAKNKDGSKTTILDTNSIQKVPWGIILLFGGGFALAKGFTSSGLSEFIGSRFSGMADVSPFILVLLVALAVNFLTELTSNTATAQMILPILGSVAVSIGMNPLLLMMTATISVSLAFMLPVATPPNTIIFAGERINIFHMVKAGVGLNIASAIITTLIVYFIGSFLFDLQQFPIWAVTK